MTDVRGRPASAPGLAAWLARVAPKNAPPEVTIALVSDARIRALNRRFRRKDAATDVLAFEPGDIAIATGVARRQAREAGHSYAQELRVLALHGLLHLIGYDHHDPADRGRMGRIERRLRGKGGLHAGLIERGERPSAVSQRERRRQRSEPAPFDQRSGRGTQRRITKRRARGESERRGRSGKT